MNVKISVFAICVEAIIYLLLHNMRDCTFKASKLNKCWRSLLEEIGKETKVLELMRTQNQ